MAWIGFLVWSAVGLLFIGLGFYLIYGTRKTIFGFWANVETFPVDDVKGYNRALGQLWCGYGVLFILLGKIQLGRCFPFWVPYLVHWV